ncbi:hypothetical protein VCRA2121O334_20059 [Vibrio crassostreae]|nr:hypothetical protein VCRA2121O334_20059 [Vibrio crassostreae]
MRTHEAHAASNDSAGARTIATIVTNPSCQLPKYRYNLKRQEHIKALII